MIKLKDLLLERGGAFDYGCLMAVVDDDSAKKILDFNYALIDEKDILNKDDLGRETAVHCTLKYGLTESYSEKKMKEMLKGIKPFKIKVVGISLFENEDFDVVKLDIKSKYLNELHEKFSKLPNEDKYKEYHPHITLCYAKKGHGKKYIRNKKKFASILINTIQYSDKGDKTFYNL